MAQSRGMGLFFLLSAAVATSACRGSHHTLPNGPEAAGTACTWQSLLSFHAERPTPEKIHQRFGPAEQTQSGQSEKYGKIDILHYSPAKPDEGSCSFIVYVDKNLIDSFEWSPGLLSKEIKIDNALKLFPNKRFTSKKAPWMGHYQPAEVYYTSTDRLVGVTVNSVRDEVESIGLSPLPDPVNIADHQRAPTSEKKKQPSR